jgi:pyruvate,water dikinase
MLEKRSKEFRAAWKDFEKAYPKQAPKIQRKLNKTMQAMEKRELIRSEFTRTLGVVRAWYLQSAQLTDLGEDIFFLQIEEVRKLLCGDQSVIADIKPRRETYQRQLELPRIPMVISGRFDPFSWANDPARRMDIYDAHAPLPEERMTDTIEGLAGSAGRVEGLVRVIHNPKETDSFKDGEILVASTTNVGWTPLFPRALAVVTDVGAPLSHAAIVARELGIPAVVGTGNATMRLEDGCRVLVDGGRGTVKILDRNGRDAKDEN